MTEVEVLKKGNIIKYVSVSGHSNFADSGSDIVCAAISTCVITSEHLLYEMSLGDKITVEELDGYVKINCLDDNKVVQKVLNNMLNILKDLSSQYPDNIEINCRRLAQ